MENPKRWIGRTKNQSSSPFSLFPLYPFLLCLGFQLCRGGYFFNVHYNGTLCRTIFPSSLVFSPPLRLPPSLLYLPIHYIPIRLSCLSNSYFMLLLTSPPPSFPLQRKKKANSVFENSTRQNFFLLHHPTYGLRERFSSESLVDFLGYRWRIRRLYAGFLGGNRPELVEQTGFFVASGTLK